MKKILSVSLAVALLASAVMAFPTSAIKPGAAEGVAELPFTKGDIRYNMEGNYIGMVQDSEGKFTESTYVQHGDSFDQMSEEQIKDPTSKLTGGDGNHGEKEKTIGDKTYAYNVSMQTLPGNGGKCCVDWEAAGGLFNEANKAILNNLTDTQYVGFTADVRAESGKTISIIPKLWMDQGHERGMTMSSAYNQSESLVLAASDEWTTIGLDEDGDLLVFAQTAAEWKSHLTSPSGGRIHMFSPEGSSDIKFQLKNLKFYVIDTSKEPADPTPIIPSKPDLKGKEITLLGKELGNEGLHLIYNSNSWYGAANVNDDAVYTMGGLKYVESDYEQAFKDEKDNVKAVLKGGSYAGDAPFTVPMFKVIPLAEPTELGVGGIDGGNAKFMVSIGSGKEMWDMFNEYFPEGMPEGYAFAISGKMRTEQGKTAKFAPVGVWGKDGYTRTWLGTNNDTKSFTVTDQWTEFGRDAAGELIPFSMDYKEVNEKLYYNSDKEKYSYAPGGGIRFINMGTEEATAQLKDFNLYIVKTNKFDAPKPVDPGTPIVPGTPDTDPTKPAPTSDSTPFAMVVLALLGATGMASFVIYKRKVSAK